MPHVAKTHDVRAAAPRARSRRSGNWSKRKTLGFIVASIVVLWGSLLGIGWAVYSLLR